MAMTSEELNDFAEEVVAEVLEIVEETEKRNNSLFRRVPNYEIAYLITTIRELSTTVLNLSKTNAVMDARIGSKDAHIESLIRDNLALKLKMAQTNNENNEKDTNV